MVHTFGNRVHYLRKQNRLTIDKLAELIGCSKRTIQRYENDEQQPDTYNLVRLSTFFNVSTDFLLGLNNKEDMISLNDFSSFNYRNYFVQFLTSKLQDVDENETYYWITRSIDEEGRKIEGGQTEFVGFLDEECTKEIRQLRAINPVGAFNLCQSVSKSPIIINNENDISLFLLFGGDAFIKASLCEEYLPHYCEPYIAERGEY